jgi:hypothetical protein
MYRPQAQNLTICAVFASLCLLRMLSDLQQTLCNTTQLSVHGTD